MPLVALCALPPEPIGYQGWFACAGDVWSTSPPVRPTASITLVRNPEGSISLKAAVNSRYVCADSAGAAPLIANRDAAGAWESFDEV